MIKCINTVYTHERTAYSLYKLPNEAILVHCFGFVINFLRNLFYPVACVFSKLLVPVSAESRWGYIWNHVSVF